MFCSRSREGTTRAPLSAMRSRNSRLSFVLAVVASTACGLSACSDTDPRYGTPEAIKGRKVPFPTGTAAEVETDADTDGGGTTQKTPQQLFGVLYNGVGGEDAVKSTCSPCHAPAGTGVTFFVGTDEASAYKIFQDKNYKDTAVPQPKGFFTKGLHTGPALTPNQQAATRKWAAAESAGGTGGTMTPDAGPTDAGGG
ncbi:MAG: hypothetical protein H0U00_12295 [Actinobacteria bacterium]|nr:hypothetical protein [Actinomycetota bacterium]